MGEIADKVTTKNIGTQYIETLTNSAEFGIISQRDFFDHDVSNMENIDGYYIVEDDSFVYNPRISTSAPVGPINRNKLGRTGVMSPLYTVFRTHDVDSEYLEWFFKSTRWHAFMKFNGDSGARSDRFSIKDALFFEMPIPIPDIDEQRKIGKYMTHLDNLITLHQRKWEQRYAVIPKPVLGSLTFSWEQRKLGEIYTERNEKGNNDLQILSVSIHSGVSDRELDEENLGKFVRRSEDKTTYKHVYPGDLIFNMMRAWQGAIGVAKSEGMISPAYISAIPNDDVYPLFMDYALRRKEAIDQIDNLSYGVTDFRKRLYWDSFTNVKCFLPSKLEQEKIWCYFKSLDNLITLHRRMFIKINRRAYK